MYNLSIEKASFKLTEDIFKAINNEKFVGGIFDCVSHNIHTKLLECHEITGRFGVLIKSYHKGGHQGVNFNTNNYINNFSTTWQK